MYMKTATAMINSASIELDFFEPVHGFVEQPHANKKGDEKKY